MEMSVAHCTLFSCFERKVSGRDIDGSGLMNQGQRRSDGWFAQHYLFPDRESYFMALCEDGGIGMGSSDGDASLPSTGHSVSEAY